MKWRKAAPGSEFSIILKYKRSQQTCIGHHKHLLANSVRGEEGRGCTKNCDETLIVYAIRRNLDCIKVLFFHILLVGMKDKYLSIGKQVDVVLLLKTRRHTTCIKELTICIS